MNINILDYNCGNTWSVKNAFNYLGIDVKIIKTKDITETINYIEQIYNKLKKNPKDLLTPNDTNYITTLKVKKKDNLTPKLCYQLQLNQIPGVSHNISSCIIEKYPSLVILVNAYNILDTDDKKINLLENMKYDISNNKKRKIGKVVSSRIYNYLICNA